MEGLRWLVSDPTYRRLIAVLLGILGGASLFLIRAPDLQHLRTGEGTEASGP